MGIFRNFPYSNFHEMNLDEIIKIVKSMLENWARYYTEWDDWKETVTSEWAEMQSFINNYFDNLNVQTEINNKITSMVNSGVFSQIVDPYVPPAVANWLAEHITAPETVVIDDSLTIEGAAADAKATGDAIQNVESTFSTLVDVHIAPNLLDVSNITNGYISNSSGSISVSGDWVTTDYMPVEYEKDYTFSCTSNGERVHSYAYFRLEFDETKSPITATYATDATSTFTPSSASTKFVRLSYHDYSNITEWCFAEGYTLTYSEYGEKTLTVAENANSEKVKKLMFSTSVVPTRNMFDITTLVAGYISDSSGRITVSGDWVTTDYLPVEYGHYYNCTSNNGLVGVYFALEVDETYTPIDYINTLAMPYTPSSADVKYLRFSVHSPATPTMVFEESKQGKSIFTPYGDELATNKGLLYKKTWVALGDSLTEKNVSAISNYTDFISVHNHMDIVNMGVGGTGYMRGYDSSNAFYQRAVNIPDCDIITIFGSGNDLAYYSNLGDVTDNTTDTICGCINETLDVIFANHPTTPLLVIAPTPWAGNTPDMTTGMALYCEKLEAICSHRGIAYLDLFHHSGLRPNDTTQRDLVFYSGSLDGHGDYVHPNKLGHSIIAPRIMQAMESVIIF